MPSKATPFPPSFLPSPSPHSSIIQQTAQGTDIKTLILLAHKIYLLSRDIHLDLLVTIITHLSTKWTPLPQLASHLPCPRRAVSIPLAVFVPCTNEQTPKPQTIQTFEIFRKRVRHFPSYPLLFESAFLVSRDMLQEQLTPFTSHIAVLTKILTFEAILMTPKRAR